MPVATAFVIAMKTRTAQADTICSLSHVKSQATFKQKFKVNIKLMKCVNQSFYSKNLEISISLHQKNQYSLELRILFKFTIFDKNWFTHLNFRSITGGFIYNFNSSESFLKIVKITEKKMQKKVSGI